MAGLPNLINACQCMTLIQCDFDQKLNTMKKFAICLCITEPGSALMHFLVALEYALEYFVAIY